MMKFNNIICGNFVSVPVVTILGCFAVATWQPEVAHAATAMSYSSTIWLNLEHFTKAGRQPKTRTLKARLLLNSGSEGVRLLAEAYNTQNALISYALADGKEMYRFTATSDFQKNTKAGRVSPRVFFRHEPIVSVRANKESNGLTSVTTGRNNSVFVRVLSGSGILGPEFIEYLSSGDPVAKAVKMAGVQAIDGSADVIDGLPMRQVVLMYAPVGGATTQYPIARRVTLAFGKTDNLLHRVITETIEPDGSRTRRTELHRNIKVNVPLPDSLFVFTPPLGAVEMPAPPPAPRSPAAPTLAGSAGTVSPRLQGTVTGEIKPGASASTGPALGTVPTFSAPGAASPKPATPQATPPKPAAGPKPPIPSTPPATGNPSHGPFSESPLASFEEVPAQAVPGQPAAETGLKVVAEDAVQVGDAGVAVASFGSVSLLDAQNVERTFRLKNSGKAPVTLDNVQTTCGCLSALVSGAAAKDSVVVAALPLPHVLQPGETVALRMRVDLTVLHPGPLTKTLLIWTREQRDTPALRLQMQGALIPLITFSPAQLTLGNVAAGSNGSTRVTATISDALLERTQKAGIEPWPALIANVPGVTAVREPAAAGSSDSNPKQAHYTVTVDKEAPIGPLFLEMGFVPTAQIKSDEQRKVAIAWRLGARLLTSAEVTGDISAPTNQVAFSLVPVDAPAESAKRHQTLTISGTSVAIAGLKAEAESSYVTARVLPRKDIKDTAGTAASASTVDVEVTLKPECPPGPLQTRLMLTIPNGQKLMVFVSGYIAPPAAPTPIPAPASPTAGTKGK